MLIGLLGISEEEEQYINNIIRQAQQFNIDISIEDLLEGVNEVLEGNITFGSLIKKNLLKLIGQEGLLKLIRYTEEENKIRILEKYQVELDIVNGCEIAYYRLDNKKISILDVIKGDCYDENNITKIVDKLTGHFLK